MNTTRCERTVWFFFSFLLSLAITGCGAANSPSNAMGRHTEDGGTAQQDMSAQGDGGATPQPDGGAASGLDGSDNAPAPMPTVQSCDSAGDAGTWQQIGPAAVLQAKTSAYSVATDALHIGTAYVGFDGGFWKTDDCGATWTHPATGRNAKTIESGAIWEIIVDPVTADIYVDSGYGGNGLYRSTNGGVDWDVITPAGTGIPSFVSSFTMDPDNHKHIVVGYHQNCTGTYAPMCFAETLDGAASWHFVVGPAKNWGEAAGVTIISGSHWLYGAPFDALYYTTDSSATWTSPVGYAGCYSDLAKNSGKFYVGCLNHPIETIGADSASLDAKKWSSVSNSPQATAVGVTGMYMYASFQNDTSGQPNTAPR